MHLHTRENFRDFAVKSGSATFQELRDADLVVLAKDGHREAFAELYKRHRDAIVAYCNRLLGDDDAANDALQASFMTALDQLAALRRPEAFRSWLFQIARNEAFTFLRRSRRNGQVGPEEVVEDATPLDQLVELESRQLAETMLAGLKVEYREILILREYENLSYAEIAEITGDSVSSVRARIFKARRAMARRYQYLFERGMS